MVDNSIRADIQSSDDPKTIEALVKLCIDSSVKIEMIYSWRNDWDEVIPDFEFECRDCEGTGQVKGDVVVGGVNANGPWQGYDEVDLECERCWGKGNVTWEDVPNVYTD